MSGLSMPVILFVRPIRSSRSFPDYRRGRLCRILSMERRISSMRKGGRWDCAVSGLLGSFRGRVSGWELVCHQSFIPKRAVAPLYDLQYRYSADFDWCIRCMKQARSFCNTHLILSDFLDGGTSTTQRKASLRERYAIMCKYYGTFVTVLLHGWFAIRFYTAKCLKGRV